MTKYIFDFDDVLFFNTEKFKRHMYACFEEVGVPHEIVQKYYQQEHDRGFVLSNLVTATFHGEDIPSISPDELTEKILGQCERFVNTELVDRIKTLGVENCFMVTHGVAAYQLEKINRAGLESFFAEIFVVQDTKKGPVEMICERFSDDEVVFVDDKEKRFADLDFEKHPNLRKVLYTGPESIVEIFLNQ